MLRADNTPLVLAVLFSAFKKEHTPAVTESRLRAMLTDELDGLRDAGEFVASKCAKDYLLEWSDQAHGYLRRHQPDSEVECHFRRVTENISVQQSAVGATRGAMVGQTLDAQVQLRRDLDVRDSAERREVGRLMQEIRALAHRSRDLLPQTKRSVGWLRVGCFIGAVWMVTVSRPCRNCGGFSPGFEVS